MNNQPNDKTGFTPHELFFGRPSWSPEVPIDPDTNPQVSSWVLEHAQMYENVSKTSKELGKKYVVRKNIGRDEASYSVGDLVLEHKKRFPQYNTIPKLSSQWFGPYKVISVHHNVVKVRASPRLGGDCEVGFSFLKRFQGAFSDDDPFPCEPGVEEEDLLSEVKEAQQRHLGDGVYGSFSVAPRVPFSSSLPLASPYPPMYEHDPIQGGGEEVGEQEQIPPGLDLARNDGVSVSLLPQVQPRTCGGELETEALSHARTQAHHDNGELEANPDPQKRGYFIVESILKYKYRQGYQFLTKWRNFSVGEATWEPTRNFVQPDGYINEVFADYCKAQGLVSAYKQALNLSNRRHTE